MRDISAPRISSFSMSMFCGPRRSEIEASSPAVSISFCCTSPSNICLRRFMASLNACVIVVFVSGENESNNDSMRVQLRLRCSRYAVRSPRLMLFIISACFASSAGSKVFSLAPNSKPSLAISGSISAFSSAAKASCASRLSAIGPRDSASLVSARLMMTLGSTFSTGRRKNDGCIPSSTSFSTSPMLAFKPRSLSLTAPAARPVGENSSTLAAASGPPTSAAMGKASLYRALCGSESSTCSSITCFRPS